MWDVVIFHREAEAKEIQMKCLAFYYMFIPI